jgi:catechol 2,3-dioxygenase-like lactoylglutathione lyase family enzyme
MMLSRSMITIGLAVLAGGAAPPAPRPARPPITGLSHLAVYTSDPAASAHFYTVDLGARRGADPEDAAGVRYYFGPTQFVEVLPLPAGHGPDRLAHVAYATSDVAAMRAYLLSRGVSPVSEVQTAGSSRWITTRDPEGNTVQFVQSLTPASSVPGAISDHMIHAGYMVHDRAAEDRFYRDILGFRPYWYGAMEPGKVDWVSQQVPDGQDWLEYMLVGPGSTTPLDHVDHNELGVLNHLSLGVPNMEAAVTRLIADDRLSPRHDGPQMGRDGKWQANLYDPDGTRIELMEFQPVTKPCCSPFTAASPER